MMTSAIANLGQRTMGRFAAFGDFCNFCMRTLGWSIPSLLSRRGLRLLLPQMYLVGTLSIPVIMVTGAFVGMVLAVQTVQQFMAIGVPSLLGSVLNHSVLRELGPVLAAIMLAGRVGGGLTAELGTMHVTEQIDALRAMGCDPVRVLATPRFLACLLLVPPLVVYTNFMGIACGSLVSIQIYGIDSANFWRHAQATVGYFDIFYGLIKSVFFGATIALISCYKGFRCAPGAAGVGRACTESFVATCMAILCLDLFLGMIMNTIYQAFYGIETIL